MARREKQKGRPQALPSPAKQVGGDFGDGRKSGVGLPCELLLNKDEVLTDKIKNLFDRQKRDGWSPVSPSARSLEPPDSPAGQDRRSAENSRRWQRQLRLATSLSHSQACAPLPRHKQVRCAAHGTRVAQDTEHPFQSKVSGVAAPSQYREDSAPSDRSNFPQRKSGSPSRLPAWHPQACC